MPESYGPIPYIFLRQCAFDFNPISSSAASGGLAWMEAGETVSILVRELAIQMLYETERRSFVMRDVLLKEAKAVAFVIAHALGLESESSDSPQLYQGNINLLAESLEVVKRTAAVILGAISPRDEPEGSN